MSRIAAVAMALALGCGSDAPGAEGDGLAFDIDLVDACGVADPFFFGVQSVEVQLRGDDSGTPCVAARRCVPVTLDAQWNPEAIEAELRAVAQPLLATERDAADFKIIGSTQPDCTFEAAGDEDVFLCGIAELSAIEGGVLEVPVECPESVSSLPVCPVEPLPDCP